MSATFRMHSGASKRVVKAAQAGLGDAGEHVLEDSNRTIPHLVGDMERSGGVSQDGNTVAVYYDTPYAPRQHEDTRIRHRDGRRAKWLELGLKERASKVAAMIADRMRSTLP